MDSKKFRLILFTAALLVFVNIWSSFVVMKQIKKMQVSYEADILYLKTYINSIENKLNSLQRISREEPPKAKEVMGPLELAEYLNVDVSKVFELIDSPKTALPYSIIGGEFRFNKNAIDEWMKHNTGAISD